MPSPDLLAETHADSINSDSEDIVCEHCDHEITVDIHTGYNGGYGEKAYEEFYVPGEKIDMERFAALGVMEQTTRHEIEEVDGFFGRLEGIFEKEDFTKAQVVEAIKEFIPNFEQEEKGKNLDQKM